MNALTARLLREAFLDAGGKHAKPTYIWRLLRTKYLAWLTRQVVQGRVPLPVPIGYIKCRSLARYIRTWAVTNDYRLDLHHNQLAEAIRQYHR